MPNPNFMRALVDCCVEVFPVKLNCPNCRMTFEYDLDEFIMVSYNTTTVFCRHCRVLIESCDSTLIDALWSIENAKKELFEED